MGHKHEYESRIDRFYRMYGKDNEMADYYAIEKRVALIEEKIKKIEQDLGETKQATTENKESIGFLTLSLDGCTRIIEKVGDKVADLNEIVSCKDISTNRLAKSDNFERKNTIKKVLAMMAEEGFADFDGKTSDETSSSVLMFAKMRGIDLPYTQGTKKSITHTIKELGGYSYDSKHKTFRRLAVVSNAD